MLILIETLIILALLLYLYKLAFTKAENHLKIPKPLAIVVFIVGFLVLPASIKALIVIILIVTYIVYQVDKSRSSQDDTTITI